MGNSGDASFNLRLNEWAEAADTGLRTAARWALEQIRKASGRSSSLDSTAREAAAQQNANERDQT
jgi:hypothetical protein